MSTRNLIIALAVFVALVGLASVIAAVMADDLLLPKRVGTIVNSCLMLYCAYALFKSRLIAAYLLALSALIYGVGGIYEVIAHHGIAGFGKVMVHYYWSLSLRLAAAAAAYFLLVSASGSHALTSRSRPTPSARP